MPAILRIFVYQTDASLSLLGLCGSYGQVGVRTTRSTPCGMVGGARVCEHDTMRPVSVVNRPSGPPDCVSNMPSVISAILSNYSGPFGLIRADGNRW
jgi:hypothetical protein